MTFKLIRFEFRLTYTVHILTSLFLLIISLSFTGCENKVGEEENNFDSTQKLPKVIDTLSVKGSYYEVDSMQNAWYSIAGVGCLDSNDVNINKEWWDREENSKPIAEVGVAKTSEINLIIDTTQHITQIVTDYDIIVEGEDYIETSKYYKAYPLFIINRSSTPSFIDIQDASFTIIQEAKNKRGEWKPIEYWTFSWCGNSYSELLLLPNYFGVTKIPIYKGDFKTELRVKLYSDKNVYYSNSY